jgi:hypothetical protein
MRLTLNHIRSKFRDLAVKHPERLNPHLHLIDSARRRYLATPDRVALETVKERPR